MAVWSCGKQQIHSVKNGLRDILRQVRLPWSFNSGLQFILITRLAANNRRLHNALL